MIIFGGGQPHASENYISCHVLHLHHTFSWCTQLSVQQLSSAIDIIITIIISSSRSSGIHENSQSLSELESFSSTSHHPERPIAVHRRTEVGLGGGAVGKRSLVQGKLCPFVTGMNLTGITFLLEFPVLQCAPGGKNLVGQKVCIQGVSFDLTDCTCG